MKRTITLLALACTLAGCDDRGGWYPNMECTQRDLPTGLCTAATYTCQEPQNLLAFYVSGPRCYTRSVK